MSAKKFVAPGLSKHPVLTLKLGSSEIVNVRFSVPLYVENAWLLIILEQASLNKLQVVTTVTLKRISWAGSLISTTESAL